MKVSIYVATHKEASFPKNDIYIPLHVGAEGKNDLGYLKDNTGDNISSKNSNYCELTGMYWIWKNDDSDIVGLTHYRRYFFKNKFSKSLKNVILKDDIVNVLKKYDIIVPNKLYFKNKTVEELYTTIHNINDYKLCRNIIKKKYPDYLKAFDTVSNNNYLYSCNMVITKKEIFDKYCKWLFDILFEVEKVVDLSNYDDYNKRLYGFLSERLFNVWMLKNKTFSIKEVPTYNIDDSIIISNIKNVLRKYI